MPLIQLDEQVQEASVEDRKREDLLKKITAPVILSKPA
jgi:hypothetical protein